MRTLLFVLLAVLAFGNPVIAEQAATSTPAPGLDECVTEADAATQLQGAAQLAAHLPTDAARQFIKLLPPLPAKWKLEDFKVVQIWAFPHGRALIILYANSGCIGLTARVDLDSALMALSKVQRAA